MNNRSGSPRVRVLGLLLGACTLWLVVQNTLLAFALLWTEPRKVLTVGSVLLKAGAALVSGFWASPAWPLLAGAAVVAALAVPALMGRAADREVLHG
jgi:hypothetical protein